MLQSKYGDRRLVNCVMEPVGWITLIVFTVDLIVRVGLSVRVIMRRLPVGVSLAWLFVVLMIPLLGAFAYLLLGELRLGV